MLSKLAHKRALQMLQPKAMASIGASADLSSMLSAMSHGQLIPGLTQSASFFNVNKVGSRSALFSGQGERYFSSQAEESSSDVSSDESGSEGEAQDQSRDINDRS